MTIWKTSPMPTLEWLNQMNQNTIHESLGIKFTSISENSLEAIMPVDHRTHQPAGLLHGGASTVLAESLGSIASLLAAGIEIDLATGGLKKGSSVKHCVGIEINASHLQGVRSGFVTGRTQPIRIGKTLHVWDIQIREGSDPQGTLVCQSRLTVLVKTQQR